MFPVPRYPFVAREMSVLITNLSKFFIFTDHILEESLQVSFLDGNLTNRWNKFHNKHNNHIRWCSTFLPDKSKL